MDKKKSLSINKFHGTATTGQASAMPRTVSERINIQLVQNVLLIWLDANIDEGNSDCRNTIAHLRRAVNSVNTFTDGDQCIQFIESVEDEKVCAVISGALAQHIVPRVHDMPQVDSIFIFCGSQKHHEAWARGWPKIKGIFTDIKPICKALKQAAHECEHNMVSISFMATSGDTGTKNLNKLNCSFMYTQMLKELLLTITFKAEHLKQFINYCREQFAENDAELKNVEKLKHKYHQETPAWWYTYECFLYPMLNRALRAMDASLIVNMGFFIVDLHRQLEQLHSEQFGGTHSGSTFTLYRGQCLSKVDFEQLTNTKGGLMAFNNFLSTSKNRKVSLSFAQGNLSTNLDLIGILFVMTVDPKQSTTQFASIAEVGYYEDKEEEILFSMHSIFRIQNIQPLDGNPRLFQVDLTLTSDNDEDLRALTDCMREDMKGATGWFGLGDLLRRMGQFDKAEELYRDLLERTTEESEKGNIYYQLGSVKDSQGEYPEAIVFYEKSLEIDRNTLSPNHLNLAHSYNNIGIVYGSMNDYPKALSNYEEALAIKQQSLPSNHPDLAASYGNIGNVYGKMGDYPKALTNYEKALAIQQQSLSPNHPNLAASYNNIALVYDNMGDYPKSLSNYEKALAIQQQSLPLNHPDFGISYNNIGAMYRDMKNYAKARSFFQRAVDIAERSLPTNHPHRQVYIKNLERIKKLQ